MLFSLNAQTGTSYTVKDPDDKEYVVTFNNSSPVAVTLPQAGASNSFITGWNCILKNIGSGTVTVTPTTSTIETAAQMIMPPGSECWIYSDGSNWFLLDVDVDTTSAGRAFFTTDGTMRPLIGLGSAVIVSTADAVIGLVCNLARAIIVNKITFSNAANASGSSQTAAVGLYDSKLNRILTSGAKTFANAASQSYPSTTVTSTLLLPGTYVTAWTCSSATPTFIATATLIGAGTSASWNGNHTSPLFFFKAGNGPSSGDLPSTLGTQTSALATGDTAGNVPIIFFET